MSTTNETSYQHLEPRPGSSYRQWFLKGRRIRAAVVWEVVHGPDHFTPEQFAEALSSGNFKRRLLAVDALQKLQQAVTSGGFKRRMLALDALMKINRQPGSEA